MPGTWQLKARVPLSPAVLGSATTCPPVETKRLQNRFQQQCVYGRLDLVTFCWTGKCISEFRMWEKARGDSSPPAVFSAVHSASCRAGVSPCVSGDIVCVIAADADGSSPASLASPHLCLHVLLTFVCGEPLPPVQLCGLLWYGCGRCTPPCIQGHCCSTVSAILNHSVLGTVYLKHRCWVVLCLSLCA